MASPPTQNQLLNPGFEEGNVGWDLTDGPWYIINTPGSAFSGTYFAGLNTSDGDSNGLANLNTVPVYTGQRVTASAYLRVISGTSSYPAGAIGAFVVLLWLNESMVPIARSDAPSVGSLGQDSGWRLNTVTGIAPAGARFLRFAVFNHNQGPNNELRVDQCTWDYAYNMAVTLSSPAEGSVHEESSVVTLAVNIAGSGPSVVEVEYFYGSTSIGSTTSAPYSLNTTSLPIGTHELTAVVTFSDGTVITSAPVEIEVEEGGEDREYLASNSHTYLILEGISGLGSAIPSIAKITGIEIVMDYTLQAFIRSKDLNITDPELSNYRVAFDATNDATAELAILSRDGDSFAALGSTIVSTIPLDLSDFTVTEEGVTEGRKWTALTTGSLSTVVGGEEDVFNLSEMDLTTFLDSAVGFRFYANAGTRPAYADSGDASFRLAINSMRVRVYFNAGNAEYYFASPDREKVIKGTLVGAEIMAGNFRTADASGVLQLTSGLEIMNGDQPWIGNDWTIHAAYPPTDNNQIGEVGDIEGEDVVGMEYNGLPTQQQVKDNRSRYQFITENFYGDPELNSMYGVHGLPRAFAFNGDYFYKIHTQPDAEKDKPRSVANHHTHLALGFNGGRVDISVVGEPYNFDGAMGASSWAFGDKVVGLLPLSGTILGVFGAKSIWGISGTTVDNFATQVISPNIGAIEYTITDMGFPVYANAYGIYTLSQTQQYGDYLGQPMSKDISPWIRPRLLRKPTSDKEVVCAFPVRSKNQYRLCFSDGYVASMTLNGQQQPTFSFQKYFNSNLCTPEWINVGEFDGWWDFTGNREDGAFVVDGGLASQGSWSVEFERPQRVRITNTKYWVSPSGMYENGFIIISNGEEIVIENSGDWHNRFDPMPLEYEGVTHIMYSAAEDNSDATVESTAYVVEVWKECEGEQPATVYDQSAIVPAAVSSELDNHGEERIHIAPYEDVIVPAAPVPVCSEVFIHNSYPDPEVIVIPDWFEIEDYDSGHIVYSNVPCLDYGANESDWRVVLEVFREGSVYYANKTQEDGNVPYGPYDGEPTLVHGYVYPWSDGCALEVSCAHISLQHSWPA